MKFLKTLFANDEPPAQCLLGPASAGPSKLQPGIAGRLEPRQAGGRRSASVWAAWAAAWATQQLRTLRRPARGNGDKEWEHRGQGWYPCGVGRAA